jgi:hypothetical protein
VETISHISALFLRISRTILSYVDFRKFPARKRTHFFINLSIGIVIVFFLHFLQHTRWGENTLDKFFDLFVSWESKKVVQVQNDVQKAPILFVDIDHETYKEWGEPLITPRDRVAKILQILHEAEAKVIVLDILLEGSDFLPDNDQKLLEVLEKIKLDPKNITKVILPQRIGFEGKLKKNLFDGLIDQYHSLGDSRFPALYRAAPSLSATSSDNVVRYWNLYEEFQSQDGGNEIIWGYPIVTVLLAIEGNLRGLESFQEKLSAKESSQSNDFEVLHLSNGKIIKLPYDKAHLYLQRLRFLLVPEKSTEEYLVEKNVGNEGNLFQTVVRYKELEYYKDFFKDKIVVVGNSSPDTGDMYRTPIGKMAGMYILGNSINTILTKEQPSPPPGWLGIFIEIVVIILAAYIFLYFTSLLAQIIASLLILIVFGYFSYLYFLKTGVFLNFVFAIVGMSFHETTKDLEEIFEKRGLIKYDQKK